MELNNEMIFQLGVEAGRKQLMDHIQHQHSIGKPVEINGDLYWLKDSREHLIDVMDSLDSESEKMVIPDYITVKELADKMNINPSIIVQWMFMHGKVATFSTVVSYEDAKCIAELYGLICEKEMED